MDSKHSPLAGIPDSIKKPSLSKTEYGFCDGDEEFTFIFCGSDRRSLTPGEFHIRPPAGLTIGLNVGRVFQSAYDLLNFAQLVAAGHLTKEGFVDAAKRVLERNHLPEHNHL